MGPNAIPLWQDSQVVILGDVMLDRFVYGRVERISPEAPIPVLHHQSGRAMLGGAANVARNIVALGGRASLIGVLGDDVDGDAISGHLCAEDGIVGRFVRVAGHPTTVKTRFVCGSQQIMRHDVERLLTVDSRIEDALVDTVTRSLGEASALILSDYAKGVLTPGVIRRVIAVARQMSLPIVVDPKTREVERYAGATVMTPNASEGTMITGHDCSVDEAAQVAVKAIRERAQVDAVVLTRGAQGMTIWAPAEGDSAVNIPTVATEVFDVSGAGDTVVATLSLAMCAGATVSEAARIANAAAGIAVGKRGTAVVRARELAKALGSEGQRGSYKVVSAEVAAEIVADWKDQGFVVGFTNGCFDLLHPGHVELLRKARATCDRLVVALNTDASVRRLKGPTRPVQDESSRSVVMASIESVNLVTLFDEDTPMRIIELLRPDRLIKGADYTVATVVGSEFVQSYGGRVELVPLEVGHSTSNIIARSHS
ncbi:D-glycero-beta-D-manno-heptose-7-phosphate kinase [Xanthobacter flavus]|uniref:D-glycero-beta-D-manno-heptose-7-phosphate kinase n=1 Tax=Xanthobacter flavus TaxID=281 RepID=UPI00372A39C7